LRCCQRSPSPPLWQAACVSTRNDLSQISTELERRSGHYVTNAKPGEMIWPVSVSLEDGLSENEAVTLALWSNAAFQETLTDLGVSRADLVQAGMFLNPTLSMLVPLGAKGLELTARAQGEMARAIPRGLAEERNHFLQRPNVIRDTVSIAGVISLRKPSGCYLPFRILRAAAKLKIIPACSERAVELRLHDEGSITWRMALLACLLHRTRTRGRQDSTCGSFLPRHFSGRGVYEAIFSVSSLNAILQCLPLGV
jgi:hypothetical protein